MYIFIKLSDFSCNNLNVKIKSLDVCERSDVVIVIVFVGCCEVYSCSMFMSKELQGIKLTNIFYLLFQNFDPFWFIFYNRFSDLLFHLFLAIFISILTWAGRKNVGTFYKLNKYKRKINTTKLIICFYIIK